VGTTLRRFELLFGDMKIGRLILRLVVGGFFFGHGTQKLFGWFGGYGLEGTGQFFEQIGLRPGKRHAMAAGVAEAGGGTLLALGAATPLASAAVVATMLTAINRVHLSKGPWISDGGYEYNVVLIAAALALAETGPGSPSVDSARDSNMHGPAWALLALLLGAVGAAGAHFAAAGSPAAPQFPAQTPPDAPTDIAQAAAQPDVAGSAEPSA
jgi:putative oxidoreductase